MRRKKIPLGLSLLITSSIPVVSILITLFFVHQIQQSETHEYLHNQEIIVKANRLLENTRNKMHVVSELRDLQQIELSFKEYHQHITVNRADLAKINAAESLILQQTSFEIQDELKKYAKYNFRHLEVDLDNSFMHTRLNNSFILLDDINNLNEKLGQYNFQQNILRLGLTVLIIIAISVLIIYRRIQVLLKSVKQITDVYSNGCENYIDPETMKLESNVVELNNIFQGAIQNSNEIYRSRQELIEKSKMAAFGEMAAYISHEILTPLTVIKLNANKMINSDKPEQIKTGETILKMVNRISKIIASTKRGIYKSNAINGEIVSEIDIQELIEEISILTSAKMMERNTTLTFEGDLNSKIMGNEGQIIQVIINLLNNSLDAIEKLDDKWIKLKIHNNDNTINIHVEDSGNGIPSEISQKLFDSFFTTKEIGKGTGIGLNISKKIIQSHGGDLVYNSLSSHTEFIISLPAK